MLSGKLSRRSLCSRLDNALLPFCACAELSNLFNRDEKTFAVGDTIVANDVRMGSQHAFYSMGDAGARRAAGRACMCAARDCPQLPA